VNCGVVQVLRAAAPCVAGLIGPSRYV